SEVRALLKIPESLNERFLFSITYNYTASNTNENSNPPETVESLHKYETRPGQAQKF
ncbi:40966_t:CDS:1, partial [Gigaspora margarita]